MNRDKPNSGKASICQWISQILWCVVKFAQNRLMSGSQLQHTRSFILQQNIYTSSILARAQPQPSIIRVFFLGGGFSSKWVWLTHNTKLSKQGCSVEPIETPLTMPLLSSKYLDSETLGGYGGYLRMRLQLDDVRMNQCCI